MNNPSYPNDKETIDVKLPKRIYKKLYLLGFLNSKERKHNEGSSNYSEHFIQPWSIWLDYPELTSWDHDIIKRVLRTKDGEDRITEYKKIIHICNERIRQLTIEKEQTPMKWEKSLEKWRKDRNITSLDDDTFIECVKSEVDEFINATIANDWHEQVDAICDIVVFVQNELDTRDVCHEPSTYNINDIAEIPDILKLSKHNYNCIPTELLQKIKQKCIEEIEKLSVIFDLAMKQTVKEISSRKQDPEQAKEWAKFGPTGKWKKDRNQSEETLYKADYNLCKMPKKSTL